MKRDKQLTSPDGKMKGEEKVNPNRIANLEVHFFSQFPRSLFLWSDESSGRMGEITQKSPIRKGLAKKNGRWIGEARQVLWLAGSLPLPVPGSCTPVYPGPMLFVASLMVPCAPRPSFISSYRQITGINTNIDTSARYCHHVEE